MKTTKNAQINFDNFTKGQIKAIALLQHLGEDFFILDDKIFMGDENEALSAYNEAHDCNLLAEDAADNYLFYEYCLFNCEQANEIDNDGYDANQDYMVLTDSEADEKAADYITDSLWAFNAEFLAGETGIDVEVFKAIQANGKCESNNQAIESCIDDMPGFIEAAISADGRGHFMSTYDGEEYEETVNGETYFIYRIN